MTNIPKRLYELDRNHLVLAGHRDRNLIQRSYVESGLFFPFRLKPESYVHPTYGPTFLPFLKQEFDISPSEAERIRSVLFAIPIDKPDLSGNLLRLQAIKMRLVEAGLYAESPVQRSQRENIYLVNGTMIEGFGPVSDQNQIWCDEIASTPVPFVKSPAKEATIREVFEQVAALIEDGVLPEDILIVNATAADDQLLSRIFADAGILFAFDKQIPVLHHPFALCFLDLARDDGYEAALSLLEENSGIDDAITKEIKKSLVDMANTYPLSVLKDDFELLRFAMERLTYCRPQPVNAVLSVPFSAIAEGKGQYVMLLNASEDSFHLQTLFDTYLSEGEKAILGLWDSASSHHFRKADLEARLARITDLVCFFTHSESGIVKQPVDLELGREIVFVEHAPKRPRFHYTRSWDRLAYAKQKYLLDTYGLLERDYASLRNTFSTTIEPYANDFAKLTSSTVEKLLDPGIRLSATSLTLFNECPFRFLLDHVLDVGTSEDSLEQYYGNLTHRIIDQRVKNPDFDLDATIREADAEFPEAERVKQGLFQKMYQKQITVVLNYLDKIFSQSKFTNFDSEWKYQYRYPEAERFVVLGKVDRILVLHRGDKTYVVVIDYKTGNATFKQDEYENGSGIQLPFYLHLLKMNPRTKDFFPAGFFYQKVTAARYDRDQASDPIQNLLRFDGVMIEDSDLVIQFTDPIWLKGIALKGDGTLAKSAKRLLSESDMETLVDKIASFIHKAVRMIEDGYFPILPIAPVGNMNESKSCEYCLNRTICHHRGKTLPDQETEGGEGDD